MYKINVLLVTYKQQDVISRAIDSVLIQKDYGLNKIVILDDCSPDDNWKVIGKYAKDYPDIIDAHRNEENLGIYKNMNKLVSLRGEADLFVFLSGDDAYCNGFFKAVQEFLIKKEVDFSIPIGIFCDWKIVKPNGKEIVSCLEAIDRGLSPFSLYIRGKAIGRGTLVNEKVLEKYGSLVWGKGLNLTESAFDSQKVRYIQKAYYVPCIAEIYYCNIGVSTRLTKTDYYTTQVINKWQYFIDNYIHETSDYWYARYGIEQARFFLKPSIMRFLKIILYYHRGRLDGLDYTIKDYFSVIKNIIRYYVRRKK